VPFRSRLVAGICGVWGASLLTAIARAGISLPHSIAMFSLEAARRCWRAFRT
jgi:hypothetical protein